MQTTDTLLMIRPVNFGFNPETAVNNHFQKEGKQEGVQKLALQEFDAFVELLRQKHIHVIVVEDTPSPHTPDSIFPNNWITLQSDSNVVLFPMNAENRRLERRLDIISQLKEEFDIQEIVDLSPFENQGKYLEGTGSMVLDYDNKIAYGCISDRLDLDIFQKYCNQFGFKAIAFHGFQTIQDKRKPIYHTNVLMCVAKEFIVVCLDAIDNLEERKEVEVTIKESGKILVEISEEQMQNFVGNMLQVQNTEGKEFMIMSDRAYRSLTSEQLKLIEKYAEIIHPELTTIENNGGGSARCMIAEVFLPKK